MKKNILRIISLLLVVCLFAGCQQDTPAGKPDEGTQVTEEDYAAFVKLDRENGYKQEEVTVKQYIDGDTVHFHSKQISGGVLKARFLAVNTPESVTIHVALVLLSKTFPLSSITE